MKTRRESIIELLESTENPLTVSDICRILEIKSKSMVYEDMGHIQKSVRAKKKKLVVYPASCAKCEFVFKGRSSLKKPSRCPKCKSEWLIPPSFMISERKK